jgi:hypothetical protein
MHTQSQITIIWGWFSEIYWYRDVTVQLWRRKENSMFMCYSYIKVEQCTFTQYHISDIMIWWWSVLVAREPPCICLAFPNNFTSLILLYTLDSWPLPILTWLCWRRKRPLSRCSTAIYVHSFLQHIWPGLICNFNTVLYAICFATFTPATVFTIFSKSGPGVSYIWEQIYSRLLSSCDLFAPPTHAHIYRPKKENTNYANYGPINRSNAVSTHAGWLSLMYPSSGNKGPVSR